MPYLDRAEALVRSRERAANAGAEAEPFMNEFLDLSARKDSSGIIHFKTKAFECVLFLSILKRSIFYSIWLWNKTLVTHTNFWGLLPALMSYRTYRLELDFLSNHIRRSLLAKNDLWLAFPLSRNKRKHCRMRSLDLSLVL